MLEDNSFTQGLDSFRNTLIDITDRQNRNVTLSINSAISGIGNAQLSGINTLSSSLGDAISSLTDTQLESFVTLSDSFGDLRASIQNITGDQLESFVTLGDSFGDLSTSLQNISNDQLESFITLNEGIESLQQDIQTLLTDQIEIFSALDNRLSAPLEITPTETLTPAPPPPAPIIEPQEEGLQSVIAQLQEENAITSLVKALEEQSTAQKIEANRQEKINEIDKALSENSNLLSAEQIQQFQSLKESLESSDSAEIENRKNQLDVADSALTALNSISSTLSEQEKKQREESSLANALEKTLAEQKAEAARQAQLAKLDLAIREKATMLTAAQLQELQDLRESLADDNLQNTEDRLERARMADRTLDALEGIAQNQELEAKAKFRESKVGKGLTILEKLFPGMPVGKLTDLAKNIMNFRTAVLPGLISGFKGLMVGLRSLALPITILIATFEGIRGFIKGFAKQEGNILQKIIRGLFTAVGQIVSTFVGLPLDLLKGVLTWLLSKFGFEEAAEILRGFSFREFYFNLYDKVGEFIANSLGPITDVIMEYFAIVGKLFKGLFESIKNIFKNVFGVISGVIIFLKSLFTGDTDAMGRGLMQIFESMFGYFKEIFKIPYKIADYIKDAVALLLSKIGFGGLAEKLKSFSFAETFENVANTIFGLFTQAFDFIKGIFTGEIDIVGLFKGLLSKAMDTLKNMGETFANLAKAIAAGSGAAIKAALPGGQSPQEAFMETFSAVMAGGQTPAQKKESYEANIERLAEVDEKLAGGNEEIESLDRRIANVKERMAAGETTNTFGESYEDILGSLKEMRKAEVAENVALSKEQFTLLTDAANYEEEMARKEITDLQQKIDEEKALIAEGDMRNWRGKSREKILAELEEEMAALQFQPILPMSQTTGATMEATMSETTQMKESQAAAAQMAVVNNTTQPTTNSTNVNNVTYTQTAHVDDTSRIVFAQPAYF